MKRNFDPDFSREKADRNVNRQSFLMKGVVTDEDGESIIGATVMIGGTSKGTVTDINGQYTLEVQSGISFIYFCGDD